MTSTVAGRARRRPMNPWRLEWLRMTRSPRGLALVVVYLFFGVTGPVLARYMSKIVELASSDVKIIAPPAEPADGLANFVDQSAQTGLLVVLVVVAGALLYDARPGLATFYRTRVPGPFALIWPRYAVATAFAVGAYTLGSLAAWYETSLMLGGLPAGRVLLGVLCGAAFLAFAVAVVALVGTVVRGTPATVGLSVVVLVLVLPVVALVEPVRRWLPTSLLTAPSDLVRGGPLGECASALAVSVLASAVLLGAAVHRAGRREL